MLLRHGQTSSTCKEGHLVAPWRGRRRGRNWAEGHCWWHFNFYWKNLPLFS